MTARAPRTGLWLVGARGSVATTAALGLLGVRAGLVGRTGMVTELPAFAGAALPPLDAMVVGGHDTETTSMVKRAEKLADSGVVPAALVRALGDELARIDAQVVQVAQHEGDQASCAARISADLTAFRTEHDLAQVVVVNVASTEPPLAPHPGHAELAALEQALTGPGRVLSTSALYAYAAFRAGCAFVDFTPGAGARLPAVAELAAREGLPWGGRDGKTGETLVKAALAPLFATRALKVRSWAGTNLLGGGDGATLADPQARASKTESKARGLEVMLPDAVDAPVHIDYLPDMGDWKTAWDHISFEGFLGTRMSMQFTWQGADSALAAPLVLDLARLTAKAHQAGRSGPLAELAFFFKDPVGTDEHRLSEQWRTLVEWASGLGAA